MFILGYLLGQNNSSSGVGRHRIDESLFMSEGITSYDDPRLAEFKDEAEDYHVPIEIVNKMKVGDEVGFGNESIGGRKHFTIVRGK